MTLHVDVHKEMKGYYLVVHRDEGSPWVDEFLSWEEFFVSLESSDSSKWKLRVGLASVWNDG